MRPYPRRAFSDGESAATLDELGLTNKQEALFLELIWCLDAICYTKQAIEVFSLLKLKYESQYTDGCGILVLIWVSTVWVMQFINIQILKDQHPVPSALLVVTKSLRRMFCIFCGRIEIIHDYWLMKLQLSFPYLPFVSFSSEFELIL